MHELVACRDIPMRPIHHCLVSALCLLVATVATADSAPLQYSVTYRGVFSMGADLSIADVVLSNELSRPGGQLVETRLEASSERFPSVEALYPFRYRFRSWAMREEARGVVAFERYQKTGRERHAIFFAGDAKAKLPRKLTPGQPADDLLLETIETGEFMAPSPLPAIWDRLGLLQHARQLPFADGHQESFDVTTGKKLLRYRVRVETAQSIVLDGRAIPAWKVRFDGALQRSDGSLKPAHRPLYVWFSRDDDRVPLRVDSRHAVGLFRVELSSLPGARQLADAER